MAANETLRRLSITDSLTGLHNRRSLQQEALRLEFSRGQRRGSPLALIAIDLDPSRSLTTAMAIRSATRY